MMIDKTVNSVYYKGNIKNDGYNQTNGRCLQSLEVDSFKAKYAIQYQHGGEEIPRSICQSPICV